MSVVSFSDLPGAWALLPALPGMAGRQRNRLTEKRGLRCPGTFESSNPRIRAQYAGGHSCFLSGNGLDAGLLVSCPRIAAAGKTNYASRGSNCVRKKKSGRSEDLPERATRPIRVRGALYLRMLPFALCCSRRFHSGYCQSRGSPFSTFSICISPVQPVLPDWTTISNYKPRYSANSPGGYFGISMLWMYVI